MIILFFLELQWEFVKYVAIDQHIKIVFWGRIS